MNTVLNVNYTTINLEKENKHGFNFVTKTSFWALKVKRDLGVKLPRQPA